ncbi:MAG: GNAT family N-acetyltransferase [Actinomycetota bacterium]
MTDLDTGVADTEVAGFADGLEETGELSFGSWPETLFHSEPWRQAVEQSFQLKIQEYVPRSEPDGIAHYSVLSDVRGERVVCTPFSDFCDPLLRTKAGWDEFADHLRGYGRPITIRPFLNPHAIDDHSFEHRRELLWQGVDLSKGADHVWDSLRSKLRTAIRRAPKQGITFRFSSSIDDIRTFHAMHVDLRKSKYRMLAQPLGFFEALHDRFGDDMAVIMAEDGDGDPVAAMIYFAWNGVWYYKFGASYPRTYRPNAAMIIEACREGADRGLTMLDMGRSDLDQPGLIDFKRDFATHERLLTTLHWKPENYTDEVGAEAGKTLGEVTTLLTDASVPNQVTAAGGDLLYRYFG